MALLSESYFTGIIIVLSSITLLLYAYFKKKLSYWKDRGVPYMEPDLLFGNARDMLLMKRSPQHFLMDLYNAAKENKIFGFYLLHRPALLIKDPDYIRQILIKDFNNFLDRYVTTSESADPLGYKNLFIIKGQPWRELRVKLTPIFTSGKLKNMFPLMCECATNLQQYFKEKSKGKPFVMESREVMSKLSTDVISTCAFGIEANSLKVDSSEIRGFGKEVFTFTSWRAYEILAMFIFPAIAKLGFTQFFTKRAADSLRKMFWDVMETRRRNYIKRNDLIDLLNELKVKGKIEDLEVKSSDKITSNDSFVFDGDNLLAQAVIFFTAGYETTSSALSFTQYELAKNKEIQNKLREEILRVLEKHDGKITYAAIQEMTYMDMVISETLRIYTPFALLDRVAMNDYVIPGTSTVIEKGTPVFISTHGLHLDPQYFPNPEKYDPERFSEENKRNIKPYTYMPFGEGPHNCIGSRFGQVVVKCGLSHILSQYEIDTCEKTAETLTFDQKAIVLYAVEGLTLKYTPLYT